MRALVLSAVIFVAACDAGNDPGPNNTLGLQCSATLTITGSFVEGQAPPLNPDGTTFMGCWPIGNWTFAAMINENDCADSPMLLPSYEFQGTLSTDMNGDYNENFAYITDPTSNYLVKVTTEGNAMCEGELDLYSTDGMKVWNLSPFLNPDNSIDGKGTYEEYTSDQWTGVSGSD
jgi:hypothetical protein